MITASNIPYQLADRVQGLSAGGVGAMPTAIMKIPCQIIWSSRPMVYRLLSRNPWQGAFPRLVERHKSTWLC